MTLDPICATQISNLIDRLLSDINLIPFKLTRIILQIFCLDS